MKNNNLFARIFVVMALLFAGAAMAGPYDFIFMQRNAADNGNTQRVIATPATTGFFTFNADTKLGGYTTLGTGLQINSGVLSATLVPGPKGDSGTPGLNGTNGTDGAPGAVGAKGDTGNTGATGQPGAKGDKGDKGDTGATGQTGQAGAQGPAGTPAPTTLRLRAQTNTAGVYNWTFATPFPAGTVPVVNVSVEDSTTASFNHSVSNVTNTGFTVTLRKTTAVTLLGISVLGVDTSPQAFVHLTAIAP